MNDQAAIPNDSHGSGGQLVPTAQSIPALRDAYGRLAGYGGSVTEEPEQLGLTLLEYWRILYKHKWLILSITAAFIVLSTVRTLMQTPEYTSTVRLQIDPLSNVVKGGDVEPAEDYDFMQTQYELLRSRTMAERVVSKLKLGDGAVGMVMGNVSVNPVLKARLVDIHYSDVDPGRAQRIANAYADAFINSNIDKRFQANESAKVFLDDKIQQLKKRLEDSEKALVDFAQSHQQLVAVEEKQSVAEANLASASEELGRIASERSKNEETWQQTEKTDAINLPQLLQDNIVEGLRQKRYELNVEYQKNLQMYKPGYPTMVALQNQIDEIDRQIALEAKTIKDSLKAAYESSVAQEEATKARVAELKNEVLDLQKSQYRVQ